MSIDFWKTLIIYTNILETVTINNSKRKLLKQIFSTPEVFTKNCPILPRKCVTVKKLSARKSLSQFLKALDVKYKTAVRRLGDTKSKRKSISSGNNLWSIISRHCVHTEITGPARCKRGNLARGAGSPTDRLTMLFALRDDVHGIGRRGGGVHGQGP